MGDMEVMRAEAAAAEAAGVMTRAEIIDRADRYMLLAKDGRGRWAMTSLANAKADQRSLSDRGIETDLVAVFDVEAAS